MMSSKKLKFGWHTVTANPTKKSRPDVVYGLELNKECIKSARDVCTPAAQIFLKSPLRVSKLKKWTSKVLDETRKYIEDTQFYLVVHGQYLINFCRPCTDIVWAIESVIDDMKVLHDMVPDNANSTTGIVIHLGKNTTKLSEKDCEQNFVGNVKAVLQGFDTSLKLILETSTKAKNGNDIFHDISKFGKLVQALKTELTPQEFDRVGLCIDTAHVFASGYDIRTKQNVEDFLAVWNKHIGLDKLTLVHLNDSKVDLHCCRDLHEEIGQGFIYKSDSSGLKELLQFCRSNDIPVISETGGEREIEISLVHSLLT